MYSSCLNPFVGKPSPANGGGGYQPTQPTFRIPTRSSTQPYMKGGALWNDLGLSLPTELYNDAISSLKNVKNTLVGDEYTTTSNVLEQKLANPKKMNAVPVDYTTNFIKADKTIAAEMETWMK